MVIQQGSARLAQVGARFLHSRISKQKKHTERRKKKKQTEKRKNKKE